ncbi:hypothetical protein D9619_010048 [Psilocybe cf. subviscida]|uniref:F-box domain-containing protein n=1 Tax=Psilocybe cf. subviscida TaxID=2480587 RepID=A0A8H5F6E7_9AGAR|nr:hypothetical protein D9619_010048 [Psilocybe cf. subviscida]
MSSDNQCVYARNHSAGEYPSTTSVEISYNEARIALSDPKTADMEGLAQKLSTSLNLEIRRNALVPVSKLPNDIVLDIFLIVRDSEMLCGSTQWLRVTQICGYWRNITVGTPSFWSRIRHTFLHEFTLLMLERSQQVPLEVAFLGAPLFLRASLNNRNQNENQDRARKAMITAILDEIKRIRKLCFDDSALSIDVQKILATLPPDRDRMLLENLEFYCPHDCFVPDAFCPPGSLRRLRLSMVNLNWGVLYLPNLTEFAFYGCHLPEEGSGARFIAALQHMSKLEVLTVALDDVGLSESASSLSTANLGPIHLPCLRILEILSDFQDSSEFFLEQIIHPRLQELYIRRRFSSPERLTQHPSIIRAVASAIKNGDFGTPELLTIGPSLLIISNRSRQLVGQRPMLFINFTVASHPAQDTFDSIIDILVLLCMTIPNGSIGVTSPLRRISVEYLDIFEDEFVTLFGHLDFLEAIEVSPDLRTVLFGALTYAITDASTTSDSEGPNGAHDHIQQDDTLLQVPISRYFLAPTERYLFASLKSITSYAPRQTEEKIHDIHKALLLRRDWGAPIVNLQLVALDDFPWDPLHVDMLQEVVDNVVIPSNISEMSSF